MWVCKKIPGSPATSSSTRTKNMRRIAALGMLKRLDKTENESPRMNPLPEPPENNISVDRPPDVIGRDHRP